jgi:hypothetical protein
MPPLKLCLAVPALLGLAACTTIEPLPGTPEFAAARVSRAYDCGLKVDRNRIMAGFDRQVRPRFVAANAAFAVKSYKAPRSCDASERSAVQREVGALFRR